MRPKFDPKCFVVVSLRFAFGPGTAETDAVVLDPLDSLEKSEKQSQEDFENDDVAEPMDADEEEEIDTEALPHIDRPKLEPHVKGVIIAGELIG